MGGLGPGIGGLEILVIGLLALIVVGPKDLPLLMRKVGKALGKARAMANEFRSSFDEMARQSELDELRKEVEALRTGQGMVPLGAESGHSSGPVSAGWTAGASTGLFRSWLMSRKVASASAPRGTSPWPRRRASTS